jgi:hypothetical protein
LKNKHTKTSSQFPGKEKKKEAALSCGLLAISISTLIPILQNKTKRRGEKRKHYSLLSKKRKQKKLKKKKVSVLLFVAKYFLGPC